MSGSMIEVSHLTRYYGEFAALDDVSFKVNAGEIIGLLGLNGAGKSTTLKVLAGLIKPSLGTVMFNGIDVVQHPEKVRPLIGYLPEAPPVYEDMTVTNFLRHIGGLKGMSGAELTKRMPEVIVLAQLQGREHQVIGTLSHGYRKRVGIAQAVIHDPKLVILDEPISGLDPEQIVGMREVIRGLAKGRAVLVSSHILGEISQTCDRLLVVHGGKLVAEGTEQELAARAGGAERLVLTVRGDANAFAAWLKGQSTIKEVRSCAAVDGGLVRAEVGLTGDVREALLVALIRADFGLRLVEGPEDELEGIFLGLTRLGRAA